MVSQPCGSACRVLTWCNSSIHELVREGVNGQIFNNADELASQLEHLLQGFPSTDTALYKLQQKLTEHTHPKHGHINMHDHWEWGSWAENWDKTMKPLLIRDVWRNDAIPVN